MTTQTDIPAQEIAGQLADMRETLSQILARLDGPRPTRAAYTVEEVAEQLGKSAYTVREWCRGGRIEASKRSQKRGGAELWNISAEEVVRIKDEGLLPPDPRRNT